MCLLGSPVLCAVVKKLNEVYKSCVTYCRSLNSQLQSFLLDKQKLMDRFSGITADKLIYSHTVHMVSSHHNVRVYSKSIYAVILFSTFV